MEEAALGFETIHERFRPRIRRYLARLVGPDEAEDLTQELFARVNRALGDFRGDCQLSTWIYRIATNVAFDRMRSESCRRRLTEPLSEATPDPAASVDERAIRGEVDECIRAFVDRLPPDYRAVVVLSDLEELSDAVIAEVLGTTVGAAKIKLHRARAQLRKLLEQGCIVSPDERNELACEPKTFRIVSFPAPVNTDREGGRGT
jgi:RNA polymerase sigma-70 factor, ECF subfamily